MTEDERRAYERDRNKDPRRRALQNRVKREWNVKNPEKRRAQEAVRAAIRRGELTRPKVCPIAGCSRTDVHAHHRDYSRPLAVAFLCSLHHKKAHQEGQR